MVNGRRPGFTLVEVVVSLVLLSVALLGLAGVATLAATSLRASLAQERAVRHAAGILDSLTFSSTGAEDSAVVNGVRYVWTAPTGAGSEIRVTATMAGARPIVLELTGRRIAVPPAAMP